LAVAIIVKTLTIRLISLPPQWPQRHERSFCHLTQEISLQRFAAVVEVDDRKPGESRADQPFFGLGIFLALSEHGTRFPCSHDRSCVGEVGLAAPRRVSVDQMQWYDREGAAQYWRHLQ
jgi:hypothetical protein